MRYNSWPMPTYHWCLGFCQSASSMKMPGGKAMFGPERNYSKCYDCCIGIRFTEPILNANHTIKCAFQLNRECTSTCQPNTLNNKYMIWPKQKVSMFPSCTLTEWGQSTKITHRLIPSCQRISDRRSAHRPTSVQVPSFLTKYSSRDIMRIGSTAGHDLWLPQTPPVLQLSSRPPLFFAECTSHDTNLGAKVCR